MTPIRPNKRACRNQYGLALIVLLSLLVLGAATLVVSEVASLSTLEAQRQQVTVDALKQAKEALVGYAARNGNLPGGLPCPDTNNNGTVDINIDYSGTNCTSYIGRLPWKTLGTGPLRDGYGECLWYALSPIFRSTLVARTSLTALNWTTPGAITLFDANGTALSSPAIAVVFSPGPPHGGQSRTSAANSTCGGTSNAADYLDTARGINNATGNGTLQFIAGAIADDFNDRVAWISSGELFSAVNKRVLAEIIGRSGNGVGKPLIDYFSANANFPWADSNVDGVQDALQTVGAVPFADLTFPVLKDENSNDVDIHNVLANNNWFGPGVTRYSVSSDRQVATLQIGSSTRVVP